MHLKPLGRDSIDGALAKAERYRFLNEPGEAESICLDILDVDPGNQPARIALLLALSDQFVEEPHAFAPAVVQSRTAAPRQHERVQRGRRPHLVENLPVIPLAEFGSFSRDQHDHMAAALASLQILRGIDQRVE